MRHTTYVVGDSNAVFTIPYLSSTGDIDRSLCQAGWTVEDVMKNLKKNTDLSKATIFLVFVGMNDKAYTGEVLAAKILELVATLRTRCPTAYIFLALPFCVDGADDKMCQHRKEAAERMKKNSAALRKDGIELITRHINQKDLFVHKYFETNKPESTQKDPLHLKEYAYRYIATPVNDYIKKYPIKQKRPPKPKLR